MPPVIELSGVSFGYPNGVEVLHDVDLVVEPGEFVAVAGPNGGGKTTLLRIMLGVERPVRGEALLWGEPASRSSRRSRIAYLPQRTQLGVDAPATVRELVTAGTVPSRGLLRPLRPTDRAAVDEAVERVGLSAVASRPLATLSGGQQQRAAIAKAIAARPELLVLDEPTAGVDADAQESLAILLARLHRDLGVTIVFVSHEFGAVERFVERLVLVRGAVVFDGFPSSLPSTWHDPSHVHP
jgi:zinc transport system ATP-binding protein